VQIVPGWGFIRDDFGAFGDVCADPTGCGLSKQAPSFVRIERVRFGVRVGTEHRRAGEFRGGRGKARHHSFRYRVAVHRHG
jgi:hypothetical protein